MIKKIISKLSLNWSLSRVIFEGYIGKISLIVIIISFLLNIFSYHPEISIGNISLNQIINKEQFFLTTLSLFFFILAYLIYIIFVPKEVSYFSEQQYLEYMLNRNKNNQLSFVTEFSFLKAYDIKKLPKYNSDSETFSNETDLFKTDNTSLDKIYQLSVLKYDYFIYKLLFCRFIITILLFLFGITFYFYPVKNAIVYIFLGV